MPGNSRKRDGMGRIVFFWEVNSGPKLKDFDIFPNKMVDIWPIWVIFTEVFCFEDWAFDFKHELKHCLLHTYWSGQWYTMQNSKQGSWGRVPSPYFPANIPTLFSTVARKTKDQILFFAFFKVLRLNPQVLSNLKLPADDSESGHEPKTKATAPL